jgi:TonB family protein
MREGFIVNAITTERLNLLTGRQMMFGLVVGLHALVIAAMLMAKITIDAKPALTAFKPITPVDVEPPPPDPPKLMPTVEDVPTTIVTPIVLPYITEPMQQPHTIEIPRIGDVEIGRVSGEPSDGIPTIQPTDLTYKAIRSPDEYYPPSSQAQGVAVVKTCVGPSGRLESRPVIERSAGDRQLDAAAVRWASEALVFIPATRNGSPVSGCKGFRVRFSLR